MLRHADALMLLKVFAFCRYFAADTYEITMPDAAAFHTGFIDYACLRCFTLHCFSPYAADMIFIYTPFSLFI